MGLALPVSCKLRVLARAQLYCSFLDSSEGMLTRSGPSIILYPVYISHLYSDHPHGKLLHILNSLRMNEFHTGIGWFVYIHEGSATVDALYIIVSIL